MKTFLFKLAVYLGVVAAFLALVFAAYTKKFPPEKSFYAASLDKHRLLATRPSPRLIFIGGSSLALGLDSARVARPLGFEPINMGLNMAVGLEFMLDEVTPFLKPGDVVVVAPEYHTLQKFYRADPEYVARLIECRPSLLRSLPFPQIKEQLDRGYLLHLGRVLRTITQVGESGGLWDNLVNPYNRRSAFNENGDVVAHHGVASPGGTSLRFALDSPEQAARAIDHLNRFQADCTRRSVRVFYSHPPFERKYFDLNRAAIDRLEAILRSRLTIPMLDTPEDMTFASEEIFDVEYHLNLPGKLRRSDKVAASLGQALK